MDAKGVHGPACHRGGTSLAAQEKRMGRMIRLSLTLSVMSLCFVTQMFLTMWKNGSFDSFGMHASSQKEYPEKRGWWSITPTTDLVWHNCYEKYDCAKLDVPLDWIDPSDELRASIAIIRYNATDRENYRGPVFINPGGPGGSGVWFVKRLAPYYQMVVGKNHDIISFDPRGVGISTPRIDCWESDENARIWEMKDVEVIDAHQGTLYDAYAHASAFSKQCASMIGGGNRTSTLLSDRSLAEAGPGRFVSTASVARDMLEIMEKAGQKKLRYWGFSYGTVLGTTFATMFPDRIDRMVNDGNVDAVEFTAGNGTHFVQDTDKVMDAFYRFCHQAGPENCTFYASSPGEIEARLERLLKTIRKHPIIVPAPQFSNKRPEVVSFSSVRRMIASALYRPLVMFPSLADALAALEEGNGRPFIDFSGQGAGDPILCENEPGPTPELPEVEDSPDATNAILCSDGGLMTDTADEFGSYVDKLVALSKSAGATMAHMRLACMGWTVEAKWRFAGPFEGNTSFPILWVANTGDNVTPLRSAVQNAKGFPGSVILVLDTYGHTSLTMPSRCAAKAINAYFQDGKLPPPDTVCDPDMMPFDKFNITALRPGSSDAIEELDSALLNLMLAPVIKP
ncbi:TAP-like protein-domain-containing protein [Bisporella sp. PMI_857]|nr:TAP-like protein-domain-containing protein [Bisporella sp. PMI_857]